MAKLRHILLHFAQGLLMGGADIIPGVSGGTMALIVGIYTRLIAALSGLFSSITEILKLDYRLAGIRFGSVEWILLLPLGLGIFTALLVGARFIPALMEAYPHESLGLFFGLVAASIAIPWKRIRRRNAVILVVAALAAALAFMLTGIPPREGAEPSLFRVFASASVAICAMILPGVSGAFLLKVLGMYEVTLAALNARDIVYIGVFILGAVVGLGLFSKLLNWLLSSWYDVTMAALVGLMLGALRALWPWQDFDRSIRLPETGEPVWGVILLGLAGFAFVTALAVWGDRIQERIEQVG